jgi:hypothetical protein
MNSLRRWARGYREVREAKVAWGSRAQDRSKEYMITVDKKR